MKRLLIILFASFLALNTLVMAENTGLEGTDVSAYLQGSYLDVQVAELKLKSAGFTVIAKYEPVKNGTTIVFTDAKLKSEASKKGRAYMAVLRLFVDDKEKSISITNPVYFGKAFMQDDYNHAVFNGELSKIIMAFPDLKASIDKLKFDDLADFHFMMGMPHYADSNELAIGKTADLVAKAKNYKKGKFEIFELKLSDDNYLLGYDLGRRTKKFVKKIGRANAAVLPYCVSIENGKASSLEPQYYLAVSYPLLTMSQFTTIATVPGAIIKDLEKVFK